VDEMTQWEVVGAAQIGEAWLIPVLEAMLKQFPFRIRGFHSDNGSDFINHTVAKLLNKLLIEQTKSRPRRSNDNGLLGESKDRTVVRKHMGYTHIAALHAEEMEVFYERYLNHYLNFHRPCGVPQKVTNANGRVKRVYRWYATPWKILRQLPDLAKYLKDGVTIQDLERRHRKRRPTLRRRKCNIAKAKLFANIQKKKLA
jgi:hypothetical protein